MLGVRYPSTDSIPMPELPEVEITRRHLEEALRGRVLSEVHVTHARTARFNSSPEEIERRLVGRRVSSVERIGKFLRFGLDDGQTIVAHLGMSGRWAVDDPVSKTHTHFQARLDDGSLVEFVDPRTFGFVAVYDDSDLGTSGLARLGDDAWNAPPTAERLAELLEKRSAPIKAVLLDQRALAGVGNIYADEALFRAGIHPLRPACDIEVRELEALLEAIAVVLSAAIQAGGTTLDDLAYLLPDGRSGEHMSSLSVYGRPDEPCDRCGTAISRIVVRSRSTHFCPECQT